MRISLRLVVVALAFAALVGAVLSMTVLDTQEGGSGQGPDRWTGSEEPAGGSGSGEYAEVFPRPIKYPLLGVNLTAYSEEGYGQESVEDAMFSVAVLGSTAVTLIPTWYMDAPDSDSIRRDEGKTPSDESLIQAMEAAHEAGLGVVLKPHVDVRDDSYRGDIQPRDRRSWYRSYREFIDHYAGLAESQEAETFVVGTELKTMSGDIDQWRRVIGAVRDRYPGPITYAANWDEVAQVQFWDDLDAIGVDAYYPLSSESGSTPTLASMTSAWRAIAGSLRTLSAHWERPVIVTEVGYPSQVGGVSRPFEVTNQPPDQALQALAYRATFNALNGSGWLRGISWWSWRADPSPEERMEVEYSPEGKRAQGELARGQWAYSDG